MNRRHTYSIWHLSVSFSSLLRLPHSRIHVIIWQKNKQTAHTITPEDSNRFEAPGNHPPLETWRRAHTLDFCSSCYDTKRTQPVWKNIFKYNYTPLLHIEASRLYKKRREKTPPPGTTSSSKRVVRKSMPVVSVVAAVLQKIGEVPLS